MSKRDDFIVSVKRLLADRVCWMCSNPECIAATSGPNSDPSKRMNVGVAAHITAAAEGGPRYDPLLSKEERREARNGIWLCQNCAKAIDDDPDRYHADLLQLWKEKAEERAEYLLGKAAADERGFQAMIAATGSRFRQSYAIAVSILRSVCGERWGTNNLAVALLGNNAKTKTFWRLVERLGTLDPIRAKFSPHTSPSQFHEDDRPTLDAAMEILRAYVQAEKTYPDFAEVQEQFLLPDPTDVEYLIRSGN